MCVIIRVMDARERWKKAFRKVRPVLAYMKPNTDSMTTDCTYAPE